MRLARLQQPGLRPRTSTPAPRRARLWALAGAVLGTLLALVAFAPAAWLASGVAAATHQRLLLAEAEGTLWRGSALMVLTGGEGSRDAALLPSRLNWTLSPHWGGLRLGLAQDCCIAPGLVLDLTPGWSGWSLAVLPASGEWVGQWPAAWLEGMGAPLNTLRPGGQMRLSARGLGLSRTGTGWQIAGQAELDLLRASSRLSTLDPLGSYRVTLSGKPDGALAVVLLTLDGALLLSGQGDTTARGLRFRGDARAAPGQEASLNNLLNIIGRRNGASSVLSIG
jgi:general secretion pathway protein N